MEDLMEVASADVAEAQYEQEQDEYQQQEQSFWEVGDTFNRFQMLAAKMARQFAWSNRQDYGNLLDDDAAQSAYVGLLEAVHKFGVEVTPLQVKSYILDQFREAVRREIKDNPWRRSTCPECGSWSVVECKHKETFRKSRQLAPEYAFGKTEHGQVNVGWTIPSEDNLLDGTLLGETVADKTDTSATERELKLERMKRLARSGISKLPADVGKLLLMRSVLWNGGVPATWPAIAAALGCARTTAIRRHQAAMVWLSGIAKSRKPHVKHKSDVPRLCSSYPFHRPNTKTMNGVGPCYCLGHNKPHYPWSQDQNFSLSIIPGFRSVEGYEVLIEERKELYVTDDHTLDAIAITQQEEEFIPYESTRWLGTTTAKCLKCKKPKMVVEHDGNNTYFDHDKSCGYLLVLKAIRPLDKSLPFRTVIRHKAVGIPGTVDEGRPMVTVQNPLVVTGTPKAKVTPIAGSDNRYKQLAPDQEEDSLFHQHDNTQAA